MKKIKSSSTAFLKVVIFVVTIVTLLGLVWFPQLEGRAANLDLVSIYKDPFIIYIYVASVPFFVGLFQAVKLLNLIDTAKAISQSGVNALKNMKVASLCLIGFIAGAELYINLFAHGDDAAGPTMLGIFMALAFGVVATAASVFQRLLQHAVDIKSENDLTV